MPRIYNIRAKTGEYEQQGEKKAKWSTLGVILESKGRKFIKMEVVPVGWDGWAELMEPTDRDGDQAPRSGRSPRRNEPPASTGPATAAGPDFDDDIPFS
jgi:hypothetical protein